MNIQLGLPSILTILFILLTELGYIAWSWYWVFAPLWLSVWLSVAIASSILLLIIFGGIKK